ncbi:relaxase domain-containing protein [Mycobacterium sp. SMC-2]|uniref:MobF family relaxase n=1 Tax=Mycobacterium TaxID=1763 RepID=UPI001CE048E8|nr:MULTISPECIES: MobF family relaxase [Mycobacterium]MCA4761179.1 relaxase domain-containing protein [Mycobacterium avium subsp. hominissuis]UXA06488.1 relaxase domain-containing protein [Mycobacterium sp. SMC-2]
MTTHKLTAGDGYQYLIRQVAVVDSTARGRAPLIDYYSSKGESPGRWVGSGLASLKSSVPRGVPASDVAQVWAVPEGSQVTEAQMKALFGEGLHPNADAITAYATARGVRGVAAINASKLGRKFYIRDGETTFARALAVAYRDHNEEAGMHWNAPIDAPTRAAIRTVVARRMFAEQYGRAPADDRELSGFIARESRARTTAVAGYDFTFSPVKSVSALWAIAPLPVAKVIEQCHEAALADALAWLESNVAFTRSGTNGVAQVNTTGLIGAAFTHRDSRAGDPDLHTHVAISNKVATIGPDGVLRWLALDGQPVHRFTVAASECYNTRLEAHLGQRLGLRFAEVASQGRGKRPVREIIGMSAELMREWSSRRMAIEARTADLAKQFQAAHGREPTHVETIALAQQATLETREAKHEPRSFAEQRHTWRAQAIEVLGDVRELTAMLGKVLSTTALQLEPVDTDWITARAAQVIAAVAQSRATWQRHHVVAEAQRVVRGSGHAANAALADKITDAALAEPLSVQYIDVDDAEMGEPHELRRRDGASVYTRHGSAIYTSQELLAAERRIINAAHQQGGRSVGDTDLELAFADSSARGKPLNAGQVALIREMACSGRRLALALAPAGTGKTTAMAALSHAWRSSGGNIVGLAPTAAAAIELGEDLSAPTDTIAKYVWSANPAGAPRRSAPPAWFSKVGPDTLVIIDEAGKAGTLELDAVITHALARGASIRMVGDDRQLASISAGGVLRDITLTTDTLTLSELVRFAHTAEGAATLAIRAGDPSGLGFYIDHHRVHVGADETAADMAYTSWTADLDAGRDSILLAPTNDIVDALNTRARLDRLAAADPETLRGHEIVLSDRLAASPGDLIRTRRNARWLRLGRNDYVRNGYRFQIIETAQHGNITARHLGTGKLVRLPASYVKKHVTLGYAATIDSTQGLTAQHGCHIVGAGYLTRQLLYVALTRGRVENHIYLSTAESDPHRVLSPKATHPETAVDVLTKTLARDGAQISATTARREARDPFLRLAAASAMYYDALGAAAEHLASPALLAKLHNTAEQIYPGLTRAQAWPMLRKHLAIIAADGRDPITTLTEAATERELFSADDAAAVTDWRIDPTGGHSVGIGPLRWLPTTPAALAADPNWGHYLHARARRVTELAYQIRDTVTHQWTPATAPAWAKPVLAANPKLAAEIAVFRAAHNVAPVDTTLLGPPQYAVRARAIQNLLQNRAQAVVRNHNPQTRRFEQLIDSINPRIRADGYWPLLAAHLAQASPSRPDLPTLVRTVAAQQPLPDELPAAALWWRLAAELTPTATLDTPHTSLRPAWITDLHTVFGSAAAETIIADPAWPGLVSAVNAADPTRWRPAELLHVAAEHLADVDPDHTIPTYHYARAITYTVDLVGGHHDHTHHQLPEQPPLHPEEEEQLPPDPHAPRIDMPATDLSTDTWRPELVEPDPLHQPVDTAAELAGLDFEDLPRQRVAPTPLPAALLDVTTLRTQYQQARADYTALRAQTLIGAGPAIRGAMPRIRELRQRADTDRPYLIAIQDVIAEWADAETRYQTATNHVEWARQQLREIQAQPDADPLDVDGAKRDLELCLLELPALSPAERYYTALQQAQAARAQAAGGAENIISGADVDNFLADLRHQDHQAALAAQRHCTQLRRELDRAELAAAAAFAAAETRSAEHITAELDQLAAELRVLEAASRYQPHRPLHLAPSAVADLPPAAASALSCTAAQPFTVGLIYAQSSPERRQALHTLHGAAAAADRKILWCSPTHEQAAAALNDELADTAATITQAHTHITTQQWQLPPGSLLIVDEAASADPHVLADLAEHAATHQSGLILLDTTGETWPPQPAQRLLRLLGSELPWTTTIDPPPKSEVIERTTPPDLDPALIQARRLHPTVLNEQLRASLTRGDQLHTTIHAAYQRHLNTTWLRQRDPGPEKPIPGIGIDDAL